jgi:hypothetical protein
MARPRKIKTLLRTHGPIPGYRRELGLHSVEVKEEDLEDYEFDRDVFLLEQIPTLRGSVIMWFDYVPIDPNVWN